MSFFNDQELRHLRDLSEGSMDVQVTVRAPSGKDYDEATGRDTFSPGEVLYQGKAMVRRMSPSRTPVVGEELTPYRSAKINLPHEAPLIPFNARATVDESARNAALVGQVFRVLGVEFDSDLVSWELSVEHMARAA
jgi:hypothetical protein